MLGSLKHAKMGYLASGKRGMCVTTPVALEHAHVSALVGAGTASTTVYGTHKTRDVE